MKRDHDAEARGLVAGMAPELRDEYAEALAEWLDATRRTAAEAAEKIGRTPPVTPGWFLRDAAVYRMELPHVEGSACIGRTLRDRHPVRVRDVTPGDRTRKILECAECGAVVPLKDKVPVPQPNLRLRAKRRARYEAALAEVSKIPGIKGDPIDDNLAEWMGLEDGRTLRRWREDGDIP